MFLKLFKNISPLGAYEKNFFRLQWALLIHLRIKDEVVCKHVFA